MTAIADQICDNILNGSLDDVLDRINQAIRSRKNVLTVDQAMKFKTGQRVQITGNISPKYLHGALAVVNAPAIPGDKHVSVTMLETRRKYREGDPVGIPASCLTAVESFDVKLTELDEVVRFV